MSPGKKINFSNPTIGYILCKVFISKIFHPKIVIFMKTFGRKLARVSVAHRYQKSKIDCLRFVMCPLLALVLQGFFFFFRGGHEQY